MPSESDPTATNRVLAMAGFIMRVGALITIVVLTIVDARSEKFDVAWWMYAGLLGMAIGASSDDIIGALGSALSSIPKGREKQ